jgi:hypothetical protein
MPTNESGPMDLRISCFTGRDSGIASGTIIVIVPGPEEEAALRHMLMAHRLCPSCLQASREGGVDDFDLLPKIIEGD